jgi:Mut7-C ubiquitin
VRSAYFRFYGSLNDIVPRHAGRQRGLRAFRERTTVKDLIEACESRVLCNVAANVGWQGERR